MWQLSFDEEYCLAAEQRVNAKCHLTRSCHGEDKYIISQTQAPVNKRVKPQVQRFAMVLS
jgi:hypothetical protein